MLEFLRPIVDFAFWLYIGLGLLGLFFLRVMWLARKDRTRSIFTLERETASVRLTRAFAGFMIVLAGMLGVYYLGLVTPTIVPPPPDTPTPTPILALPPTPTPPPLLLTPTQTPTVLPTPTPVDALIDINGATPTPLPAATAANPVTSSGQPPSCPNSAARISQPGNNAQVAGVVQIMGAAAIDNFQYYKFEFRDPGSGEWVFISRFENMVPSGVLGAWNSDTVPPGDYDFRLVVVDNTGNFPEPCVVRLQVQ
ncbi:MAG: hypothetical protein H6631_00960 [Anaerolineaceae bacterium]|nr:hypothetical protein [Anaerolineaceae bacterium]MCB9098130.1 hypothetical protein [Anaerolineales bacterium]